MEVSQNQYIRALKEQADYCYLQVSSTIQNIPHDIGFATRHFAARYLGGAFLEIFLRAVFGQFSSMQKSFSSTVDYQRYIIPYKVIVVAPIIEEIIFRGFLQTYLSAMNATIFKVVNVTYREIYQVDQDMISSKTQRRISQVASGILFGAVHFLNPFRLHDRIIQTILASEAGIFFGMLKDQRGILPCIVSHMANNAITCSIIYIFSNLLSYKK